MGPDRAGPGALDTLRDRGDMPARAVHDGRAMGSGATAMYRALTRASQCRRAMTPWLCPYHGNAYKPKQCVCCSLAVKRNKRESNS